MCSIPVTAGMNSIMPVRFTSARFSSSRAGTDSGSSALRAATARRMAWRASSSVRPCSARAIW
jgi:hypothetical protein